MHRESTNPCSLWAEELCDNFQFAGEFAWALNEEARALCRDEKFATEQCTRRPAPRWWVSHVA